jgi:hypothetical protein
MHIFGVTATGNINNARTVAINFAVTRSTGTTGASHSVNFTAGNNVTPTTCTRNAPTSTLALPSNLFVDPGGRLNYAIAIRNNDNANCPASMFTATPSVSPSGATFNPTARSFILSPGETSTHQAFAVDLPDNAPGGSRTLTFSFTSPSHTTPVTQSTGFTVLGTGITPPFVTISGIANNETISPAANTHIIATASHSTGIARIEIFINDRLVGRCNNPRNNTCDVFVKGSNTVTGQHMLRVVATAKDTDQTTGTANMTFRR